MTLKIFLLITVFYVTNVVDKRIVYPAVDLGNFQVSSKEIIHLNVVDFMFFFTF